MKNVLMLLALLLALSVVVRADCNPINCLLGYHSVCVQQCDPNSPPQPVCDKVCKCHCEKDQ
jgi:hypothetical protein